MMKLMTRCSNKEQTNNLDVSHTLVVIAIIKEGKKKQGEIEKAGIWKVNMTDRIKHGSKMSECIKMEDKKKTKTRKQKQNTDDMR